MNHLAKSILYTITWFDIFDYPLTLDEIYWWLYFPYHRKEPEKSAESKVLDSADFSGSFLPLSGSNPHALREEIKHTLKNELGHTVQEKDNFYFLKYRQETILSRQQRYKYSKKKMKRVKRLQQFLKYFPFIKMVSLCDFMGYMNAQQDSDIDLFIIVQKNRLFTARFWLTGVLKILNLRPKLKTGLKKDKFCLSFWVTEDNTDLEKVAIDFNQAQTHNRSLTQATPSQACLFNFGDIYFHYWLAGLKPIYDTDDYFQKFLQNNQWVKKYIPHLEKYYQDLDLPAYQLSRLPTRTRLFEKIQPQSLERFYKWFQLRWMPQELKELSKVELGVIIRDNLLKFHLKDKREEFRQKFMEKLKIFNSHQKNGLTPKL